MTPLSLYPEVSFQATLWLLMVLSHVSWFYIVFMWSFMLWCIAGSHARPDLQCIRVWLVVDNAVVHNYLPITAAHKTLQTQISVGAAQCMPFSPGAGPKPFTPSSLCKNPLMESINWLVGAWKLSLSAYLLILLAVSFPSIFCLFSGSKWHFQLFFMACKVSWSSIVQEEACYYCTACMHSV